MMVLAANGLDLLIGLAGFAGLAGLFFLGCWLLDKFEEAVGWDQGIDFHDGSYNGIYPRLRMIPKPYEERIQDIEDGREAIRQTLAALLESAGIEGHPVGEDSST